MVMRQSPLEFELMGSMRGLEENVFFYAYTNMHAIEQKSIFFVKISIIFMIDLTAK